MHGSLEAEQLHLAVEQALFLHLVSSRTSEGLVLSDGSSFITSPAIPVTG